MRRELVMDVCGWQHESLRSNMSILFRRTLIKWIALTSASSHGCIKVTFWKSIWLSSILINQVDEDRPQHHCQGSHTAVRVGKRDSNGEREGVRTAGISSDPVSSDHAER